MRELSIFTGSGGGLLGSMLLGWTVTAAVECEPYCQRVLCARGGYMADTERDGLPASEIGRGAGPRGDTQGGEVGAEQPPRPVGCENGGADLAHFPVHPDVRTFHPVPGSCDIVTGGFPCQPFSQAGKRLGEDDPRNMWPHAVRVLVESGAPLGFFENVPGLLSSGYFGTVLGDLAEAGFDAEWCVLGADDVGAPHRRKRLWILAYRSDDRTGWRQQLAQGSEGLHHRPEHGGASPWWVDPADVPDTYALGCGDGFIGPVPPCELGGTGESTDAMGDPEQGMCGRRSDEARRGPEGRAAAGRAGADSGWEDDWLAEPYVGRPFDGLAEELGRQRDAARQRVLALASLLPSIPYAILHSWDNESQNSRRSASDAES